MSSLPDPTSAASNSSVASRSILGAYDDLIEVNRRRIALLEEMARRLFEEWFVRFRFPGTKATRWSRRQMDHCRRDGDTRTLGELSRD